MSRIEVLGLDKQPVGYFFTFEAISKIRSLDLPEFEKVKGEWVPSGGIDYEAQGPKAWYHAPVTVGEIMEVSDED